MPAFSTRRLRKVLLIAQVTQLNRSSQDFRQCEARLRTFNQNLSRCDASPSTCWKIRRTVEIIPRCGILKVSEDGRRIGLAGWVSYFSLSPSPHPDPALDRSVAVYLLTSLPEIFGSTFHGACLSSQIATDTSPHTHWVPVVVWRDWSSPSKLIRSSPSRGQARRSQPRVP